VPRVLSDAPSTKARAQAPRVRLVWQHTCKQVKRHVCAEGCPTTLGPLVKLDSIALDRECNAPNRNC